MKKTIIFLSLVVIAGLTLLKFKPAPKPLMAEKIDARLLNPVEKSGQTIFLEGVDQSDARVLAKLGDTETELTADLAACAHCHGLAGRGGTYEGGEAPDIRAQVLFDAPGGPLYNEESLRRLLEKGATHEDGREQVTKMPRYSFDEAQWAALFAYLKRMGHAREPGVDAREIRLGVLQDDTVEEATLGPEQAFHATLRTAIGELNQRGGIGGRTVNLISLDDPQLERFDDLFMLIAYRQHRSQLLEILETDSSLPMLSVHADSEADLQRPRPMSYSLYPSPYLYARRGTEFARKQLNFKVISVSPETPDGMAWERGARDESLNLGDMIMVSCHFHPEQMDHEDFIACLHMRNKRAYLFQGTEQQMADFKKILAAEQLDTPVIAASQLNESPDFLWARAKNFPQVAWITAIPPWEPGRNPEQALQSHFERHKISRRPVTSDRDAMLIAELLTEVFQRTGSELNRLDWISKLEDLGDFQSMWNPSISFSRSKKVGATGSRLVGWDSGKKQLKEMAPWQTTELPSKLQAP